jgi:hypothetical protein
MDRFAKMISVFAVALLLASNAYAQNRLSRGYGSDTSCAKWLSSRLDETIGTQWLLGFMSGANYTGTPTNVGHGTDGAGLIALAKRQCKADPSLALDTVATKIYERFASEGR